MDLLWFDNDKHTPMAEKIAGAIIHFEDRFEQPTRIVRVSTKDHTDLGNAQFVSSLDLQLVVVVWSGKVPKSHMSLSSSELTTER